jgi:hypothetical protein
LCLLIRLSLSGEKLAKTASHHPLTNEKLLTLSSCGFVNPRLKRDLFPRSLLKITFPTGSFWIR